MWYIHEIEYYPVLKRNRILMNAPTWMNLLCKVKQNRHERTDTVGFQLYEVSGIGKFLEIEVTRGWGGEGMGKDLLFYRYGLPIWDGGKLLETDGRNGGTAL